MQGNSESRAEALARVGRFGEALRELGRASGHAEPLGTQVLRAELLEHTGAYDEAVDLARRIVCARQLDNARASRCEVVLGHIAMTAGRTGEALDRYRRAVSLATLAGDLEQLCWAQIRLVYAERTRVDLPGVRALLSDLRANAFRLGNPHVT
ncbi:MAG TPA: hypothetical protein VNE16_05060, partial [Vicinamibacterales bacterium]|nr:hypothetical protein [Vicinamibacterales bacterium]